MVIEPPNAADTDAIARQLLFAGQLLYELTGEEPTQSLSDLPVLQRALTQLNPDQTYELQSLGLIFGRAFLSEHSDFDWWMVEDEFGRDPAFRWKETSLLLFPLTMLSKRVEDGEEVVVAELYEGLSKKVDSIKSKL